MGDLSTGLVDLIVTSPPYWNLIDYNHLKQLGKNISYKQFILSKEEFTRMYEGIEGRWVGMFYCKFGTGITNEY